MAETAARPTLHVEGTDDLHTLVNLLIRNGVAYPAGRPIETAPRNLPRIHPAGSVESLLTLVEVAIKSATDQPVGFVLDADSPSLDRWRQVRDRLTRCGVDAPSTPPEDGFLGVSTDFRARVGVWLMPDNRRDGKLEDFLFDLIADDDPLIELVREATTEARLRGAAFSAPDVVKAEIHAWLAWQKEPGKPYGQALTARYFGHESPAAAGFVAWFRELYGLAERVAEAAI